MLKFHSFHSTCFKNSRRFIFSKTGIWDEEISLETKLEIEQHWKCAVQTNKPTENDKSKPKFYVLAMFPYPSGHLHLGHARVYTISDAIARFHRMRGKYVIHPMGWDAFGLPAENAARERNVDPAAWTNDNIESMRTQLMKLGLCLDWDREINTCDPRYYAGTQRVFLELWKAGLIYQDESMVNWDPVDETVLADEQVDSQGISWRSGAKVERRLLTQWFIRTTKFARQLLEGLDSPVLENWRDIIQLQKHWLGECDGTMLNFSLHDQHGETSTLKVWTRCPEESGMFVAVSQQHPLNCAEHLIDNQPCPDTALVLKSSVTNLLYGNTLPIIVLNMEENKRDDNGYLGVSSRDSDLELVSLLKLNTSSQASVLTREQAISKAQQLGIGGSIVSSHLRDWLISRQRRWGTPIPVVKCLANCGCQTVPEAELPVKFPASNVSLEQWKSTTCPKCGGPAERETDTMDTFVDSSWYYLRFLDPHNDKSAFDPKVVEPYMPVDLYVGGKEHAVLHLYYARFMCHFLHSLGWVSETEPFRRLLVQGMMMGKSFQVKSTGKYLTADQVDTSGPKPKEKLTDEAVVETWEKMSKSKHNGVDPNSVLSQLGCDATRLALLADVAPTSHRKWSSDTYHGIINWQRRLWFTIGDFLKARKEQQSVDEASLAAEETRLWDSRNFYISGATFNYSISQQLSVAITKMQGLTNSLRKTPKTLSGKSVQFERCLAVQIVMLAPIAPHFASELWTAFTSAAPMLSTDFDWNKTVLQQNWPTLDAEYKSNLRIRLSQRDLLVLKVPQSAETSMTKEDALKLALAQSEVVSAIGQWTLTENFSLQVHPGYELLLDLETVRPEGLEKLPKQPKEKKRKKKIIKVV